MSSSQIFGDSSIPNQMTSSERYASGGNVRRKVTAGSRTTASGFTTPMRSPSGMPTSAA